MVKFGKAIKERLVSGWETNYVPYNTLKKRIKGIALEKQQGRLVDATKHSNDFFGELKKSIVESHAFFVEQVDAESGDPLTATSAKVFNSWTAMSHGGACGDAEKAVLAELAAKCCKIKSIEQFSKLNRTAVRKIVKKFDKKVTAWRSAEVNREMKRQNAFADDRLDQLAHSYQGLYELVAQLKGEPTDYLNRKMQDIQEELPPPYEEVNVVAAVEADAEADPSWKKRCMSSMSPSVIIAILLILTGAYAMIVGLGFNPTLIETAVFIGVPVAFLMAAANGANDIANSMGTSVGAGALTVRQALLTSVVFEVAGAMSMGGEVSKSISKGILKTDAFEGSEPLFAWGMVCVLVGSMGTTLLATIYGYPISATHSIIAALVAVGLAAKGSDTINGSGVAKTCIGWVASPLAGLLVSMLLHTGTIKAVLQAKHKQRRAGQARPVFITITIGIAVALILVKGPPAARLKPVWLAILVSLGAGGGCALLDFAMVKFVKKASKAKVGVAVVVAATADVDADAETATLPVASSSDLPKLRAGTSSLGAEEPAVTATEALVLVAPLPFRLIGLAGNSGGSKAAGEVMAGGEESNEGSGNDTDTESIISEADAAELLELQEAEKQFVPLLILSAVSVAFAHGANDLGNAVGPLAAIWEVHTEGQIRTKPNIEWWAVGLGAAGFATGILLLGERTIDTVGNKLNALTPSKAFGTQIGAAIVVLVSSAIGLAVSTSHILIGCVVGVGLAERICSAGGEINWKILLKIMLAWAVTIPLAMLAAIIVFYMAQHVYR